MKSENMICSGDVACKGRLKNQYIYSENLQGKRQLGRLRLRWRDNMKQTVWVGQVTAVV